MKLTPKVSLTPADIMSMSKKHYQTIAEVIRTVTNRDPQITPYDIEDIADAIADMFAADNPRFDRAKFLAAAGFERP